ncbi:hypothetical protein CF095_13705 [Clostridium botulinum]
MFGEDILKYHGVGISKDNFNKEYKKIRSVNLSAYSNDIRAFAFLVDNIVVSPSYNIIDKVPTFQIYTFNIDTDTKPTITINVPNASKLSYGSVTKSYVYASYYDYNDEKNCKLLVLNRTANRIIKTISLGDIYESNISNIIEDPITGKIAMMRTRYNSQYLTVFDNNMNKIKNEFYVGDTGPYLTKQSFFYDGYIYSSNSNGEYVKYDYISESNVKSYQHGTSAIVINANAKRILLINRGELLDFDLNLIEEITDASDTWIENEEQNLNGKGLIFTKYVYNLDYSIDNKDINARSAIELPLGGYNTWIYVSGDLKSLVFNYSGLLNIYKR